MSVGQTSEVTERPAVRAAAVPEENRWVKCPRDSAFIYHKRLDRNLKVCPECNYHFRISARDRLAYLLDPGSFQDLSGDIEPRDPLGFVDSKPYPARIQEAQKKTGQKEGTIYGIGTIDGTPLVVAVMEFAFIGGAMGSAVGEAVTRAAELAVRKRLPLLAVCASGGARMQEGCISLMQMAKTSAALAVLAEHRLPYLVLLTDPTYGGVTASFATLGDVLIAEPDAMIGFAGRSVIESTIKQKLPDDFQRADFLLEHGMVDMVVPRGELRITLSKLLNCFRAAVAGRRPTADELPEVGEVPAVKADQPGRDVWETVQLARHPDRPNTLEYISRIFSDFHRLHGDRLFREDPAIVGGLARLGQVQCMVLGTLKGRSIKENMERNFGMAHPEGYRKALRLMQQAAKFHLPIIAFVDTPGAYPGIGAEERGQSVAIARNLFEMARFPVPILTVLTGEGGSGGALALAVADRVLMLENSYYSVISPEGCSVILFKDVTAAPRAAKALRITAHDLKQLGVIEDIVPEPPGGAHTDPDATARYLKAVLVRHLRELLPKDPGKLVEERYARFRGF
ncbi:MAG TPA: acetyl-CoA carboxylase carboxyltransferase subunit alpha [Gemmataceae bacterium]|nr:acetyl-CoA carboxylase carboxyltransferase subunit alpha [Gemmataceae bacterium]